VAISAGDAFIVNASVKRELSKVYNYISYCPQFDALFEELTGRETLKIHALIRGVPRSQIPSVVKNLSEKLGFAKYLKMRVKNYSGGNRRKLSMALALIGDPQIIFLDEPTTGMDAGARRQAWNTIIEAQSEGKAVVLTSHSMEECEALCTKLAIMVKGEFRCMGSIQHLKSKFSSGFILTIKAGTNKKVPDFEHIQRVKDFVNVQFLDAILK
jgi:ATP-binding cassette subfamily A (ABC1) protein 3